MCPFRVLVILISMLIALLATMAALAKDPADEEAELQSQSPAAAPKSVWSRFVDFWTGRYLYRESKRMLPSCFFSADEQEEETIEECAAAAGADAVATDDHRTPGEEGRVVAPAELAEPSAPELDEDAAAAAGADAAFARAYKRHPGVVGLSEAGIAAVIS